MCKSIFQQQKLKRRSQGTAQNESNKLNIPCQYLVRPGEEAGNDAIAK